MEGGDWMGRDDLLGAITTRKLSVCNLCSPRRRGVWEQSGSWLHRSAPQGQD